jgi:hypothetical protein
MHDSDNRAARYFRNALDLENMLVEAEELRDSLAADPGGTAYSDVLQSVSPELQALVSQPLTPGAGHVENVVTVHEALLEKKRRLKSECPEAYELVEVRFECRDDPTAGPNTGE